MLQASGSKAPVDRFVGILVGGFNPSEKHQSNWKSSPNRGENKKSLKPPPSIVYGPVLYETFCTSKRLVGFLAPDF